MEANIYEQMQLPSGKSCSDCLHCQLCLALGYSKPQNTICDFYPSRFAQVTSRDSRHYAAHFNALMRNQQ